MTQARGLALALVLAMLQLTVPQCLTHYDYFDLTSGSCQPCGVDCLSCFSSTVCTQCVPEYYLVGTGCLQCSFGCAACTSGTACSTCNDGLYITSSGTCSACGGGVATCTLATVQTCQDAYFMLGTICAGCFTNCKTCSDFVTCSQCSLNYYLGPTATNCLSCPSNCRICTDGTSCSECTSGYTPSGSGCTAASCTSIDPFCVSCAGGQCLSCTEGKYLSNGACKQGGSLLCLSATGPYYTDCVTSSYGCQSYSSVQSQNGNPMTVCLPMSASKQSEYLYSIPVYTCSGSCSSLNTVTMSYSTSQTYFQTTFHLKVRFYSSSTSRTLTASLLA